MIYKAQESFAETLDREDPLAKLREEFLFPRDPEGFPIRHFVGNSLGLQPRKVRQYVDEALDDWAKWGAEGHVKGEHPWLPYHEQVMEPLARVVGALPHEVVPMNTLTVNLHLMMVSFYQPTRERYKILIEEGAFPSDQYAVASQARFHGYDPEQAVMRLQPRPGEDLLRHEDILSTLEKEGSEIALVLLGNVNYLTGQAFNTAEITKAAQAQGCKVGFDLAHGVGNLLLRLHDWNVDFAIWCSYKYLNSGPGALGGCFIHERYHRPSLEAEVGSSQPSFARFEGWWGHNKKTRFAMPSTFEPIPTAEAWQLSNPPIFQLAAMRASLELFDQATLPELRKKSEKLTGYLEFLFQDLPASVCTQVTSRKAEERGAQLSFRFHLSQSQAMEMVAQLGRAGVITDFRAPDILRFAPAPFYCSFMDIYRLRQILGKSLESLGRL